MNGVKIEAMLKMCGVLHEPTTKQILVAGGFPRDILNNVEPNDIDIFVDSSIPYLTIGLNKKIKNAFPGCGVKENRKTYRFGNTNVQVQTDDVSFDIIFQKDPEKYILKSFDFDICKVWYDYIKGEYVVSGEYQMDVENKTFTLLLCNFSKDQHEWIIGRAMLHHLPKLQAKYPEHTLRIIR